MSEKMRLIECENLDCKHVFEMPESNIVSMDHNLCVLYNKVICPKCGKKVKKPYDYNLKATLKMRKVECGNYDCRFLFEVHEGEVKSVSNGGEHDGVWCHLYKNTICPECGRKGRSLYDHDLVLLSRKRSAEETNAPVSCPRCKSTQFYASDKGFSFSKALIGTLVAGEAGLLAGYLGHKKVYLTCLSCGHNWKVGK